MPKEKLTEEEFIEILIENDGLFEKTSKAIEKIINSPYSRQAVRQRALRHPDLLKEIEEKNIEVAHGALLGLIRQNGNLEVKFKAVRYYTQTKGKAKFNTKPDEKPQQEFKEQIIKIGNTVLKFLTPWKGK